MSYLFEQEENGKNLGIFQNDFLGGKVLKVNVKLIGKVFDDYWHQM